MQTSIDVFAKVRDHDRAELLAAAREADVLPYFHLLTSPAMPVVEMEGAERIMLGSNNYLGLTGDERVVQGAEQALHRYGTGLTGSRLLNGTIPLHLELEREIAQWMETEDAIVFTTGHQANVGALGTLLGPQDTVIADSGDHASILDGCLLSRAKLRPFRHNRLDKLEKMLQRAQDDGGGILVVVDGVFSMEGDIAPLPDICDLCERYGARLMVDEAHGAGVLGARGAGTAELLGVADRVDLRMGTFSKSLASCGGFVAGSHEVIEYLRLYSRAFLFTASAVPAAVGAALAALRVLRSEDGAPLLAAVLENARRLRDGLEERGFAVVRPQHLPNGESIVTPIVPVLVGDDWKAALLWRALYDEGVFVNTALHPAVPPGGALLRTSVMATHDEAVLERALDVFARVKRTFEAEHGPLPGPGDH
ncbi:MAG TPA: aminotransferase class I/II-fold pyridoxal phosphate-dependent enzyme [Solirubrobacteraceae bacterium]|nr:aminotransferase class I/II-fold pyridoxal phosphate-dependent enzyme [Solirubrobacteraceae bacterium]